MSLVALDEADLLGCYDVTEGEWTEGRVAGLMGSGDELLSDTSAVQPMALPSALGLDSAFYQIPPRIQLAVPPADTTFLGSAGQVVVPEGSLPTPHAYMSHTVQGGTLRLSFSTGYSGVVARLGRNGGGAWTGTADTTSDNLPYRSWSRRIDLTPVACDSPPPVPSSVMRPVPRSVQLVGGATITLGEPLPESIETMPRRSGALTIMGQTAGPFGTAASIVVFVSPTHGVVGRIRLLYMSPDMHPILDARISEAFGAAERIDPFGQPSPERPEWRNRVTRVTLTRGNQPPHYTYLNLHDYRYPDW